MQTKQTHVSHTFLLNTTQKTALGESKQFWFDQLFFVGEIEIENKLIWNLL